MAISQPASGSPTPPRVVPAWGIERWAGALERFASRHTAWILTAWSTLYFAGTMWRAHGRPFWYDEILTLLEARQPTLRAALRAGGDADWMPPLNHVLFYVTNRLVGHGEIAFRLPAMLGFWLFCLCLFVFVRRRAGIWFAFMAMLLPFASAFQFYSYEARSYTLMLGCCGVALVSWQAAAEGRKRAFSLTGLAFAIALAVSLNYWSVLIYLPLAGAEAYRNLRQRRVDWPVWMAFLAGGTPLVASLVLILHTMKIGSHPWSPASARDYLTSYHMAFRASFAFFLPALVLLGAAWLLGADQEESAGARSPSIPAHEWLAAASFLLIPVAGVTAALAAPPHLFTFRYVSPVVAGYALLGSFLAARLAGKRAAAGLACAIAAFAPFAYLMTQGQHLPTPLERNGLLFQTLEKNSVVVDIYTLFLESWYYAPENLKPRIIYLADQPSAVKYRHEDEISIQAYQGFGAPVVAYRDFVFPGKEFLVYGLPGGRWEKKVRYDGGAAEVVGQRNGFELLRVRVK